MRDSPIYKKQKPLAGTGNFQYTESMMSDVGSMRKKD